MLIGIAVARCFGKMSADEPPFRAQDQESIPPYRRTLPIRAALAHLRICGGLHASGSRWFSCPPVPRHNLPCRRLSSLFALAYGLDDRSVALDKYSHHEIRPTIHQDPVRTVGVEAPTVLRASSLAEVHEPGAQELEAPWCARTRTYR